MSRADKLTIAVCTNFACGFSCVYPGELSSSNDFWWSQIQSIAFRDLATLGQRRSLQLRCRQRSKSCQWSRRQNVLRERPKLLTHVPPRKQTNQTGLGYALSCFAPPSKESAHVLKAQFPKASRPLRLVALGELCPLSIFDSNRSRI